MIVDERGLDKQREAQKIEVKMFIKDLEGRIATIEKMPDVQHYYKVGETDPEAQKEFLEDSGGLLDQLQNLWFLRRQVQLLTRENVFHEKKDPEAMAEVFLSGGAAIFTIGEERKGRYEEKHDLYDGLDLEERKKLVAMTTEGPLRNFRVFQRQLMEKRPPLGSPTRERDLVSWTSMAQEEIQRYREKHPEIKSMEEELKRLRDKERECYGDDYGKEE